MIDEDTDTEFEALLTATLAEMIPAAHRAAEHRSVIGRPRVRRDSRRFALVGSALVAAAGIAAFVLLQTHHVATPTPPAGQPPTGGTPATISVPSIDDEHSPVPFDGVAVAPGTIGWFHLGHTPAPLTARIGAEQRWSDAYTSIFFTCADWDRAKPMLTCTRLEGGNYISHTRYGSNLEIGTQLGDGVDAAKVLWAMAQGSLWGYDRQQSPPTPTVVRIGTIDGVSDRNGDTAYLAWQRSPGVVVWLKATGFTDAEMAQLAAAVEPVQLPATLPLITSIGTPANDLHGVRRWIHLASVHGVRCVGITLYNQCTRADQGPVLVHTLDGSDPAVGAVMDTGRAATLVVTLRNGDRRRVPLVVADLGLQTALYTQPSGVTMVAAEIVDASGATISTIDLATSSP